MNCLLTIISVCLLTADPPVFQARTVDGRQVAGVLAEWGEESLTLQTGESRETFPLADLAALTAARSPSNRPREDALRIQLSDGSVIVGSRFTIQAAQGVVRTDAEERLEIPAAAIAHVRFRPATAPLDEEWARILRAETDQDLLVIGRQESLDYLRGVIRSIGEETVEFELEGEVLPVKLERVFGLRFYRPLAGEKGEPAARFHDAHGSLWVARSAELAANVLRLQTPAGATIDLPLSSLLRVEFAAQNLVYLSALEPASYRWTPYFGPVAEIPSLNQFFRPRRNQTLHSGPIVLDGAEYRHGLALHSRTEIAYRLGEPFARFQALVGIDDQFKPRGNVRLQISGDHRVLFEEEVLGTEPARAIELDLTGVVELRILVDFGGDLDVGDHLILAEAKLLK